MPIDDPFIALHRRLGARRGVSDEADDDDGEDTGSDPETAVPSWIPDGRPAGGRAWLDEVRADPARAGGIALAVIAVLAVLITVFTLIGHRPAAVASAELPPVEVAGTPTSTPGSTPSPTLAAAQSLVVSVVGLVGKPGLVTLAPGARVAEAVEAAGGVLRGADTAGLNLARHLVDGEQIVVGIAIPAGRPAALGSAASGAGAGPAPPSAPVKPVGPLNLNTATVEEFDALPGVGPVTAAAIVAWRTANGRFASVDQLGEVDGIGPARLERLRRLVRV